MGAGAPKCRTCAKAEFNHRCSGPLEPKVKKRDRRLSARTYYDKVRRDRDGRKPRKGGG